MSLHFDLLGQARLLARKELRRPKQASLRRAVSGTYYAVFHFLVEQSTKLFLSSRRDRQPLRYCLSRAFHHGNMLRVSRQFASGSVTDKLSPGFEPQPLERKLRSVAQAFSDLLEARHAADYNRARRFTREEVLSLIDLAEEAFDDWQTIRRSLQADTYLVGLLAFSAMQG